MTQEPYLDSSNPRPRLYSCPSLRTLQLPREKPTWTKQGLSSVADIGGQGGHGGGIFWGHFLTGKPKFGRGGMTSVSAIDCLYPLPPPLRVSNHRSKCVAHNNAQIEVGSPNRSRTKSKMGNEQKQRWGLRGPAPTFRPLPQMSGP